MQFTDLKGEVDSIFKNHPKHAAFIEKIDTAQALFEYFKTQEQNQNLYQKGFTLKCNFPVKAFLEKIWIEELFNALIAELDELLAEADLEEEKREEIDGFKNNLLNVKNLFSEQIEKIKEPTPTTKKFFPQLAINDNTILFYSQNDFSSIIGALIEKFSEEISGGLEFEIYLPPNQSEKLSDQENIRNYAEIVFEKAAEKGVDPDKCTLTINHKKIDPSTMFKDSYAHWQKQSATVFETRLKNAIKEEERHYKGYM